MDFTDERTPKGRPVGIVRELDKLGRVVIPKEYCRLLKIGPGTPIEIQMYDNETVFFQVYKGPRADK